MQIPHEAVAVRWSESICHRRKPGRRTSVEAKSEYPVRNAMQRSCGPQPFARVTAAFASFLCMAQKKGRFFIMKKSTKILLTVLALVLVGGAFVGAWVMFSPNAVQGGKTIEVEVTHLDGKEVSFTLNTEEEYLAPALMEEELISGTQEEYGLFIDTVDGEYADPALNHWWVFTVNGEMGMYGADAQPIADGDVYAFSIYEG